LQRASKTCELAGFGAVAEVDADLLEWDCGHWEGKLTSDILKVQPGWEFYRDGCADGESPQDVAARVAGRQKNTRPAAGGMPFQRASIIRMMWPLVTLTRRTFTPSPAAWEVRW